MSWNEIPTSSRFAIKTVAFGRMAVGAGTLLAPAFACDLFGIGLGPSSHLIARLFAVRDLALGAYLLNTCTNLESSSSSYVAPEQKPLSGVPTENANPWLRRELRRALWLGMSCDAVDTLSCAFSIWEGTLAGKGIWLTGGGAVELVILALIGLRKV